MSQKIIEATQTANSYGYIYVAVLGILLIAIIIGGIVKYIYTKKEQKYSRKRRELLDISRENTANQLEDENEDEEEDLDAEINTLNDKIEKTHTISEKLEDINMYIGAALAISFFVGLFILSLLTSSLTPKSSYINEVKDTVYDNVRVNAYYTIEYSNSDKLTLAVFVKNESNEALESAWLVEGNTSSKVEIRYLEPGEEQIYTMEVYPTKDKNYEFKLEQIEFTSSLKNEK